MKKNLRRGVLLLILSLFLPVFSGTLSSVNGLTKAEAAARKAEVSGTNHTIGIASTPEYLNIDYMKDTAVYTFSSKNPKIATVDKEGTITGVSKGKTTIVVKETYKKKTTVIGSYAITVTAAGLKEKEKTMILFTENPIDLSFINFKAKYSYTVSDPTIIKVEAGNLLRALKAGTTTVTVKETYKKVTRNLGSVKVNVVVSTIAADSVNVDVPLNSYVSERDISMENYSWDSLYSCESLNPEIAQVYMGTGPWEESNFYIKGITAGKAEINIYLEYKGEKAFVGTINVTVKNIPVTGIKFSKEDLPSDSKGNQYLTLYLNDVGNTLIYRVKKEPRNVSSPVTFHSDDKSVVTVDEEGGLKPVKAGIATITVTCGSFTDKLIVKVKE